jgi:hypothetical protein
MLEVAVVDVPGKGIDAGTRALLLSGAFGGLLGSVPASEFLSACNAYLRRSERPEGFVTAVHLALDLTTGSYVIGSSGHPPAAHFESGSGRWLLTQARGIVLGVVPDLREGEEHGMLRAGDALMLYTDGLVEVPGRDIDVGIDRLLGDEARKAHGLPLHAGLRLDVGRRATAHARVAEVLGEAADAVVERVRGKPLVVDLCCGLGGWTRGFLAEGFDAIGFDIERHVYGGQALPGATGAPGHQDAARVAVSRRNGDRGLAAPTCTLDGDLGSQTVSRYLPWHVGC